MPRKLYIINKKEEAEALWIQKMSILEKMIESERIYGADEPWVEYRKALTDFIINNCRDRLSQGDTETCPEKLGQGEDLNKHISLPTLAIFGVGEAWDLDLRKLSEHYRLILIDRNTDGAKRAIDRYGVKDAVVADIPFWQHSHEDAHIFEELLQDGIEPEIVVEHLQDIVRANSFKLTEETTQKNETMKFDYTVGVGLHSQLNARFAGLLYAYKRNYDEEELLEIEASIRAMNDAAVTRLNDLMYKLTKRKMIWGYEITAVENDREQQRVLEALESRDRNAIRQISRVEGALQLERDIALHNGYDMKVTAEDILIWPFRWQMPEKRYVMQILAAEPIQ